MGILKRFYFRKIDIYFLALFFLSFLHPFLGLLFYIALLYYWRCGTEGCLKALIFLTTRGIMNPAIATQTYFPAFRWIVLLGSTSLILISAKLRGANKTKYNKVFLITLYFFIIVFGFGLFISSYPVTSSFKLISFTVTFLAVIKGMAATEHIFKLKEFFVGFYTILFIVSALMIPFPYFRVINTDFQGIFNHVNIFGVIGTLYLAAFLNSEWFKEHKYFRNVVCIGIFIMIYLSASRTGMISAILVLMVYLITNHRLFTWKKIGIILGVVLILLFSNHFSMIIDDGINEFLYKNNAESIWSSREEIVTAYKQKYEEEPLFGTGFMVPYEREFKDYSLNFDLKVEPGNIIWALLGDVGIIGTGLFWIMALIILLNGKLKRLHMLLGAYVVCMGEMVFFSVNNMSILLYLLIGAYMFDHESVDEGGIQ